MALGSAYSVDIDFASTHFPKGIALMNEETQSARSSSRGQKMRVASPSLILIFGASGDLAKRKLIPALFKVYGEGLLPENTTILGYARSQYTDEAFRETVRDSIEAHGEGDFDPALWERFVQGLFYQAGGYDDAPSFLALAARIKAIEAERETGGNRLFYMATPPTVFECIAQELGNADLAAPLPGGWTRLVVEKPFGHDLASAKALNAHLQGIFDEEQIYRIDHYLGKETVQNILVFRFGNGIFEPIWNRNYVDHVQITVSESLGVEGRGGYYDKSGAVRDILQNHGLQLLALTAMEPPASFDPKSVRDQKVNALRSIRPMRLEEVRRDSVRGQYTAGTVNGEEIPGYLDEKGVAVGSTTETYVAWRLEIDNWRWNGVPFYLRTGKALPKKVTEISVVFRHAPHLLFQKAAVEDQIISNVITLHIQPDEGISLRFGAKSPGPTMAINPVNMDFDYSESFGAKPADAYERLLLDVVLGDSTLFTRSDEVEVAWNRVNRLLDGWAAEDTFNRSAGEAHLPSYIPGSWGPDEADELLARDGRRWRNG